MTEAPIVKVIQDDDEVEEQGEKKHISSAVLSKSWSIASSHVPTYSGGKITHSHSEGLVTDSSDQPAPFLVLPIDGDLILVHAQRGVKIRSIRQDGIQDMTDEDDDGIDTEAITAHALSLNDDVLMTCSQNHLIRQYSLSDPTQVKIWGKSGHTLPVTCMKFHQSNVFLATASVDGTVRIWDVRGAYTTHVFRPYQGVESSGMRGVTSIQWKSTNSKELVIAIGREDGSIAIHDLRDTDNNNLIFLHDHGSAVTCMDWKNDNFFISTGRDAVINIWRREKLGPEDGEGEEEPKRKKKKKKGKNSQRQTFERVHTKPVYEEVEGMVILPSEDLLIATAGSKGIVRIWRSKLHEAGKFSQLECIVEQSQCEAFGDLKGGYMDLIHSFLPKDDETNKPGQLIVADAEHNLLFLSLQEAQQLSTTRTIVGHNDEILDLKLIPHEGRESTHAVVATNSAKVRLFELGTFSCDILDGHSATVLCVDVSPCGRFIATCGKDKTVRLWLTSSRKCLAIATGHTEAIGAVALSQKPGKYELTGKAAINGGGSFLVSASKDRTLKRWNLPGASVLVEEAIEMDLKTFCSTRAHEKDINIVSVAPNDSLVATGSQDKTVKLWNATDLTLRAVLKGHRRGVWDCQFSSFDRVVATASGDRTVKLWSLSDYSCVRTFQGHVASALRVRFLSGGLQLVSGGADGLIKLWTIRTNDCESTFDGHQDKVWALDMSKDGKQLVSGGADSKLLIWADTTKQEEESKRAVEEHNILMEQRLSNYLRHNEYEKALDLALELEKPREVLKVLTSLVESEVQKGETGLGILQQHATKWPLEKVKQIVTYCRDWNTRARNSHLAMLVVQAITTSIPAKTLASTDGLPQILAGITPYAERHFDRLDRMYSNAFLLDYTLFSMGSLDDENSIQEDFAKWEIHSKYVLPPKAADCRIQIGGSIVHGLTKQMSDEEGDIMSIGYSDSSDDDST